MGTDQMVERLEAAIASWNAGDLDQYMTLYDEGVAVHGYAPVPMTKEEVRAFYEGIFAGLPGSQIELQDIFGSGDRIVARFIQTGRHDGELLGVPPTGRDVAMAGITILAFGDAGVVERWASADLMGLMVQIGAIPPPG
jgi:predicted ester cyclase